MFIRSGAEWLMGFVSALSVGNFSVYQGSGLDTMTILTIRYKTVIVNHEELRHRNKGRNTNQDGLSHRDFELL